MTTTSTKTAIAIVVEESELDLTKRSGALSPGLLSLRAAVGEDGSPVRAFKRQTPDETLTPMSNGAGDTVSVVPGRSCGECSLCCKLLRIEAFNKPVGTWCVHCAPGRGGCKIYASRPAECRDFYCQWLVSPGLGPEWRPNRCKMFLRLEGNLIALHVDPNDPTAWRREPYFQQLKEFASKAVDSKQQVVVYIKDRVIVIFPNREIDLGTMNPGDQLVVKRGIGPHGRDWKAYIEKGTGPKALRS